MSDALQAFWVMVKAFRMDQDVELATVLEPPLDGFADIVDALEIAISGR
jgi:hypothetical protein